MEKQFKGAVFFDYDGTLTDKDAGLFVPSQKTVEAIKCLQKNGYAACLATGRSLKYVPKFDNPKNKLGAKIPPQPPPPFVALEAKTLKSTIMAK